MPHQALGILARFGWLQPMRAAWASSIKRSALMDADAGLCLAGDERSGGAHQRLRLIPVRRVAALGEFQQLGVG